MSRRRREWDFLVVGGGTAGLVGAQVAAHLGARVALVERARTGGDCLWTGCVPSKSLLAAAGRAADVRRASALGLRVEGLSVDFPAVMRRVRVAIDTIEPVDSPAALREAGVEVLAGHARFVASRAVTVGGETHAFRRALLATGAEPAVPDIPGMAQAQPLSSETVWELGDLPPRLAVLGGGSVGCELGQAFARLGSQVTIVEVRDRLLAREDPQASAVVRGALEADGVEVLLGSRVVRVLPGAGGGGEAVVEDRAAREERVIGYDALLLAVGRRPRTGGMGLDAAGVAVHRGGFVVTDQQLRTTNGRVWAAGDVTAYPHLTHLAGVHAGLATGNALLGLRRRVDVTAIPRVTFTDPEVASVGAPSWAPDGASPPRTLTRPHDHVDRAVTDGRTEGFSRLVLDSAGRRVVGATLVGPRAGESLAELTLAVRKRMRLTDLVTTVHAYPTYGDGPWNAAIDEVRRRMGRPGARRAVSAVLLARRHL